MSTNVGSLRTRLWYRWKSLDLPWRRRRLVGVDLAGTTYWEFQDALNSNRMRRIAEHGPRVHYSEIQTTPQWHQWLRHTRNEPPSIQELRQDMERKSQLKILAKQADERWAAKPSVLDSPTATSQARSATLPLNRESAEEPPKSDDQRSEEDATSEVVADPRALPKRKENPWATDRGGAGENWQPKAWSPETLKK